MKNTGKNKFLSSSISKIHMILLLMVFFLSLPLLAALKEEVSFVIRDVPFFPQDKHQCGPASLAGVMNYWGTKITAEKISKDIYSDSARGTLWIDLALYARDHGFSASQYYGNWEDLIMNVNAGFPLIVFVDYGVRPVQSNHFMVVVGFRKDGVIVNSGKDKQKFEPKRKFMKVWRKTQYWTLLIRPEKQLFEYKK